MPLSKHCRFQLLSGAGVELYVVLSSNNFATQMFPYGRAFGLKNRMVTTRNRDCLNLCYDTQRSERVSISLIISTLKDYRFPNVSCALHCGGLCCGLENSRKGAVTKLEKEILVTPETSPAVSESEQTSDEEEQKFVPLFFAVLGRSSVFYRHIWLSPGYRAER